MRKEERRAQCRVTWLWMVEMIGVLGSMINRRSYGVRMKSEWLSGGGEIRMVKLESEW